jgi:malate dehydrogenase (oxaloacetate-decarboxylating)
MTIGKGSQYSITIRVEIKYQLGMLAKVLTALSAAGGDVGAIDIVSVSPQKVVRDITVNARDEAHEEALVNSLKSLEGVQVVNVSDRVFLLHLGGKISITSKSPLQTRAELTMAYVPGVARVCKAIHDDPSKAYTLTIKGNTIAIVTDGTSLLEFGDMGPEAALPVMEAKAMIFKRFAGVDAFPLCLGTKEPEEIIRVVKRIAPTFGGIDLEDISAPKCFQIEERLQEELDIPVFHDNQHGTAVAILAAVYNAVKIVKKDLTRLKVVINGAGASGIATGKILLSVGVKDIILCDRKGTIYKGRAENMNFMKEWISRLTNPKGIKGSLADGMKGSDLFIGLSVPNQVTAEMIQSMASDRVVFAMANPVPEVMPDEAMPLCRIMATGRSDYPNQINNVLASPGIFKGALEVRASTVNEEMKIAAAKALAGLISDEELHEDYIIPSIFNPKVAEEVARAVAQAARESGAAKRRPR